MFISLLRRSAAHILLIGSLALTAAAGIVALTSAPASAQEADLGEEDPFAFRSDEELFQLEEVVMLIAGSLNLIADQVSILAINSLTFGKNMDSDFRQKARVIFLEQLLEANPAIKLMQCQECQKLETKIVRGTLRIKKGIPSGEARKELAKNLGADGFIDIGVFREGRQLTVYIQVIEAETGAIILVEELTGRRAPKRETLSFGFGEMIFPIKVGGTDIEHVALVLSAAEGIQLTQRVSFSVELVIYIDNNENNAQAAHITLDAGAILAPTIGYDVLQFHSSASRLVLYAGLGKAISPQLNYANMYKAGALFVVGDELEVLLGFNNFPENNLAQSNGQDVVLTGTGMELRFGYRF